MKKYILIFVLVITTLLIISCSPAPTDLPSSPDSTISPQTPVQEQSPEQLKEVTKEPITKTALPSIPSPPAKSESAKETASEPKKTTPPSALTPLPTSTPPTEKVKPSNLSAKVRTTPPALPPPIPITSFDEFTGSTIDTTTYNTKTTGNSSILQNNKIIIHGNSNQGISWASLYTTKKYNLQDNYNLSVDVNFNGSVEFGSAHAVLGLENLPTLTESKNPERGYCELSITRNDHILRMSKTIKHLEPNTSLSGTLNLYWNDKIGKLICTFNGQTITQYQDPQSGEYYGSIRSGINSVSDGGGIETTGTGNYEVTFDNFFIKQN